MYYLLIVCQLEKCSKICGIFSHSSAFSNAPIPLNNDNTFNFSIIIFAPFVFFEN